MKMPVCPFCEQEMIVTKFVGYYDEFVFWSCKCEDEVLEPHVKEPQYGAYTCG